MPSLGKKVFSFISALDADEWSHTATVAQNVNISPRCKWGERTLFENDHAGKMCHKTAVRAACVGSL